MFEKVVQGRSQSVEAPDHDRVSRAEEVQQVRELGPLGGGGCLLNENPPATGFTPRIELQLRVLFAGRDPRVAEQIAHGWTVPKLVGGVSYRPIDCEPGFDADGDLLVPQRAISQRFPIAVVFGTP